MSEVSRSIDWCQRVRACHRAGWHESAHAAQVRFEAVLSTNPSAQLALDLVGVFVFALSGGLVAVKKRFDLFGVLVLACAAGLGGGILRDLLIGDIPPVGISDWRLLSAATVAGLVTFFFHPGVERITRFVRVLDAVGGTTWAHSHLARQSGDVLTLTQDRAFVAMDLLDRPPGPLGHLVGRQAGADHRLHLLGAQAVAHLDRQPALAGTVAAHCASQRLVERHSEVDPLVVGQQQMRSEVVDTDEPEVEHV